ncbi:type II secretion system F family protein [Pelagibius marinus]|uniref:type II secretion system F family protein n=1 Tax=Pelagibius marinus TaxID=2762760 RepID=UPI001872F4BF|nr:type II secretion system F family protein [Pelagibius marinus]
MKIATDLYTSGFAWILQNPADAFLVVLFFTIVLAVVGVASISGNKGAVSRRLAGDTVSMGGMDAGPRLRYETRDGFWNELVGAIEKRVPLVDETNRSLVQRRLLQAGFAGPGVVRNYFAIRFFTTICLPLGFLLLAPMFGASLSNQKVLLVPLALCVIGLYLPSFWLSRRIASRQRAIAEGFPDALDMMVVCVEAGLGLDAAFNRVGSELVRAHPALATQFALVALELRAGKSRADALRNLGERVGLDDVIGFVTLLIQSDELGTSISQALSVHADEMRNKRMMRAEELAHKLPVKLTIPLIVFILPCMVTVILLPGIIGIVRVVLPALHGG